MVGIGLVVLVIVVEDGYCIGKVIVGVYWIGEVVVVVVDWVWLG